MPRTKKLTRILSIDGGGIRGILPGHVLVELERILQLKTQDANARIADYFDLFAGTSTGGILACLLLCPETSRSPRPRFTAKQTVDLYLERGDEIFDVSIWKTLHSVGGLTDEKFDERELERALHDYLGGVKLSQLLKPCLITSYNIEKRYPHFFTQHDAVNKPSYDFYVRDVARATSAAPTFFEAARVTSLTGTAYPLVDGGLVANNPALCAYAEARSMRFPKRSRYPTLKDMAILSLGTGEIKKSYPYEKAKDWGLVEWVRPVIDILMTANSDTVQYELAQMFDAVGRSAQYLRVIPTLHNASPDMDNASPANLKALQEAGTITAAAHRRRLEAFADLLIRNQ